MVRYGLPEKILFCKKCVMPNTRPCSCNEYKHTAAKRHQYIAFDAQGICSACRFNEAKENNQIDWRAREKELRALLDAHRSADGSYDCIVPGSGGKDSGFAAHVLKNKYRMHPLTVTWSPHLYTDIGWKNFQNWIHVGGFDNYLCTPNGKIHRLITRNAFLNLLHPFQPFVLGQKAFAPKIADAFNIPLIFFGESPGEYGTNIAVGEKQFVLGDIIREQKEKKSAGYKMDMLSSGERPEDIYLGGKPLSAYIKEGLTLGDFASYLPLDPQIIQKKKIEFHYLGYYLKWVPQECYYYSVTHTGFEANPERTEGTYSKYNSIDDKIDGFFYYTTFIKFGYGRATQDAAQEIRNHHLTREEGIALINRFDGEFPTRYLSEFLDYIGVSLKEFREVTDSFRDPHLWERKENEWRLKYRVV